MSDKLTRREVQCVRLAGQSLSNKEIAAKLNLSPSTVNNHLSRAYAKLGTLTGTPPRAWSREITQISPDSSPYLSPTWQPPRAEYAASSENRYRFAWIVAMIDPIVRAADVDADLVLLARRRWRRFVSNACSTICCRR